MTTIVTATGTLQDADFWKSWPRSGSVQMYGGTWQDYAAIYRSQPNVRTCVEFLARNIAQLGLHVFQRVDENDRKRLRDHDLARLIEKPNPWTTRHRMLTYLMGDLGVYHRSIWLKVKADGGAGMNLLRVPPPLVTVEGGLFPKSYHIAFREPRDFKPEQVVHFRGGYNPDDPIDGLSPLETLRRLLAEDDAAGRDREGFWTNSMRPSAIIKRPATSKDWTDPQRERFATEFYDAYAGPDNRGTIPILEDGMDIMTLGYNAEESQYIESRKLTREEVARAYHIPLPMVGILDHATFSNIREQHKNLYQDCLGPWLDMIQEDIELQLLPEFADIEGVYVEFNLMQKLAGTFEEQAAVLSSAIGRPYMTPNEGRARLNLPSMGGDADELAVPLNIDPGGDGGTTAVPPPAVAAARQRVLARQQSAVTSGKPWDAERWNRELMTDLAAAGVAYPLAMAQAINEEHRGQLEQRTNGHAVVGRN